MGNITCVLDKEGLEVENCCTAVGSTAEIRDTWSRSAHVSRRCLQGRVTPGARCLPKVTGPVSLVGRDRTANASFPWEQANWQWHHQALLTIKHLLHTCSPRNDEQRQEPMPESGGARPVSHQGMPRDAIPSEGVGRRVKVCGTTLWRYHHCHELTRSHSRARESPVRLRASKLGLNHSSALPASWALRGLFLFLSD